ncbi:hypothetical protein [Paenibacillus sp. IHBB 3054]|uniref:hypothetical protein n=1 Tax=Paenibacillus sp. IHBB 3054 TaxID=3425689 RepID=UPI003F660D1A
MGNDIQSDHNFLIQMLNIHGIQLSHEQRILAGIVIRDPQLDFVVTARSGYQSVGLVSFHASGDQQFRVCSKLLGQLYLL